MVTGNLAATVDEQRKVSLSVRQLLPAIYAYRTQRQGRHPSPQEDSFADLHIPVLDLALSSEDLHLREAILLLRCAFPPTCLILNDGLRLRNQE